MLPPIEEIDPLAARVGCREQFVPYGPQERNLTITGENVPANKLDRTYALERKCQHRSLGVALDECRIGGVEGFRPAAQPGAGLERISIGLAQARIGNVPGISVVAGRSSRGI